MSSRFGPSWTPEEDRLLASCYYRFGSYRTAEIITEKFGRVRSRNAVKARSRRVLRGLGIPEGWVGVVEVEQSRSDPRVATFAIAKHAQRDGVLRTIRAFGGTTRIVPAEWAEEYVRQRAEMDILVRTTRDWLKTPQVAALLGVSKSYLHYARRDKEKRPLWAYIKDIAHHVVQDGALLEVRWHPNEARMAARHYRADKATSRKGKRYA